MRILILALILALVGWIGGGSWYWVCKVKGNCNDEITEIAADSTLDTPAIDDMVKPPEFVVDYQNKPLLSDNSNFRFPKSGAIGFVPGAIKAKITSLATQLKENPETDIEITGLYGSGETNSTNFSNLGLGRADFVARLLAQNGVSPDRIIKSFNLDDNSMVFTPQDTLLGGISLRLLDRQPQEAVAEADGEAEGESDGESTEEGAENARLPVPASIDPRDLYFDYNSSNLSMDDDLRDYISKAIQYLKQNADKKLVLTGHTDNAGSAPANQSLGLQRANTVKKYFQDFGLTASQIIVASKGQSAPIAPNTTEAGRSKNRRVEVRIQ